MVRVADIKRGLYVDFYKQGGEMDTETRVLTGSTRSISPAEVPTLPFLPKTTPPVAAGTTPAILLAGRTAFLHDLPDHSVRAASGVEALTNMPVLSQILSVAARGNAVRFLVTMPPVTRPASAPPYGPVPASLPNRQMASVGAARASPKSQEARC